MVASVISSYTMTAYNTCLFLWARDVEKAQAQGRSMQVTAPAHWQRYWDKYQPEINGDEQGY